MIDCFVAAETPFEHAKLMSDLLFAADYRGHYSHGMNRLEWYINDLLCKKSVNPHAVPQILSETAATAWVDGCNGLGAVVGRYCMDLAIEKAKTSGVGWVCAKGSNHYGIAGWYSIHAEQQGLIGLSMTNTSPAMCPTRGKGAALGTNPISLAAPALNGDSFVLDMATTTVATGKIEMQMRKNQPIPAGWALNSNGDITTDAKAALEANSSLPLGGCEITSGYKGYGLSAMVEILCGVSAGSHFASNVPKWALNDAPRDANLGQVFIAVDPNCFAPGFRDRMTEMNQTLRDWPRADASKPVLIPGDPERAHMARVDQENAIWYTINQVESCNQLASQLNITPIHIST